MIDKEEFRKQLGEWLSIQRQKAGLSLEEAAKKARIANVRLEEIEKGKISPLLKEIAKLTRAYNLSQVSVVTFLAKLQVGRLK